MSNSVHSKSWAGKPNPTQQAYAKSCDINRIVAQGKKNGLIAENKKGELIVSDLLKRPGSVFGDFTGFPDYQTALGRVAEANSAFQALPAAIRDRFKNDCGEMVKFLENPDNLEESYKIGLRKKPVEPPVYVDREGYVLVSKTSNIRQLNGEGKPFKFQPKGDSPAPAPAVG